MRTLLWRTLAALALGLLVAGLVRQPGQVVVGSPGPKQPPARTHRRPTSRTTEPLDFHAELAKLAGLATAIDQAYEDDDLPRAEQLEGRSQDYAEDILDAFDDAGRRCLRDLNSLGDAEQQALRATCVRLIESSLRRWQTQRDASRSRNAQRYQERLDRLTTELLHSIAVSPELATDLSQPLRGSPFLGASHEIDVLKLAELAEERPTLRQVARALLWTLWQNLERDGGRCMDGLALLFLDEANSVKRWTALRHLLTAAGGRYRAAILRDLLDRHDHATLGDLIVAMATDLPPAAALTELNGLVEQNWRSSGKKGTQADIAGLREYLLAALTKLAQRCPSDQRTLVNRRISELRR